MSRSSSLDRLPNDILAYLIYDLINDRPTLVSLTQTSSLLRTFSLRRLYSENVTLNFANASNISSIPSDFLNSANNRSIGLTRSLKINTNTVESTSLLRSRDYVQYLSDSRNFVERCHGVETATIREYEWLRDDGVSDVVEWSQAVLSLPKLRTVFIDPCGRHHFRSMPDDQHLACMEGPDEEITKERGIRCLSVQTTSNGIYSCDYSSYASLIRDTISKNIRTLNKLWFNGLELQEALKDVPEGALSDIRLKSLSIRRLGDHKPFVKAFGLKPSFLRPGGLEDAVTGLEYLYLSDGQHNAEAELELLGYLHTPRLRSIQLGAKVFDARILPERISALLYGYLLSFDSLERFGTSRAPKKACRAVLSRIAPQHPKLKDFAAWYAWKVVEGVVRPESGDRVIKKVEGLEVLLEPTRGSEGVFKTLGMIFQSRSTTMASLTTLTVGGKPWEQEYFSAREIAAIISAILYIQQKRSNSNTKFTWTSNELQFSPMAETPARRALFNKLSMKQSSPWFSKDMMRRAKEDSVAEYLRTVSYCLPKSKWKASVPSWDEDGLRNRDEVVKSLCDAIVYDIPRNLNKIELRMKEETVGKPWPENEREWGFVWEKSRRSWEAEQC